MKVTFVINTLGFGGAAKMMISVADYLKEKGKDVSIVDLNMYKCSDRKPVDIHCVSSNIKYQAGIYYNLKCMRFVYREVKRIGPDVIVSFLEMSNFCAAVVGKLLRIPVIISERGDPFTLYMNPPFTVKFKLWCINKAEGAVFQTEGASMFYSKKLQKRCAIIPNTISRTSIIANTAYTAKPHTIVTHGRFDNRQKRFDVLLEGFKMFVSSHPDYKLIIYGLGPDEQFIREMVSNLEISDSVVIKGKTNNPMQDISKEGIYVITSDFEGISNSLLEAMAVGLPVISTDHSPGGARMLITHKENGLLIPVGNPKALSDALMLYANDPKLAEKCGKNAMKVLEKFSKEKILSKWVGYTENVVSLYNN